jgi:hypothetical protein
MKKKDKKNILLGLIIILLIFGVSFYLLFRNNKGEKDSSNINSAVQDISDTENETIEGNNISEVSGIYENKKAGISFSYPKSFKITQDNLGSSEINSKLILKDDSLDVSITVYQNLHGINPQFSDYIYHMVKSGDSFIISKRVEGEIPERDTESFSVIANFGDAEGTSKVNGSTMVMILNSKPNNTYEEEFKKVVTSLKEI